MSLVRNQERTWNEDKADSIIRALLLPDIHAQATSLQNLYSSAPLPSDIPALRLPPILHLITYEAQLPAAGGRWQGFRRLRDDLSGRIDRRFALSNDPPTAIDHHVRPQAELRT